MGMSAQPGTRRWLAQTLAVAMCAGTAFGALAAPAKGQNANKAAAKDDKKDKELSKDPFDRGRELYMQGKFEESLASFKQAAEKNKKDHIVLAWLGFLQHKTGKNDDAITTLKDSIEIQQMADTYNNLGNAYLAKDQTDNAIEAYKKAIALNKEKDPKKESADPHYNLGNALVKKGDLEAAELSFLEAEKLAPEDPLIQNNLGFVLERKNAADPAKTPITEAVARYKRAVQKDPRNPVFQRNLGLAARRAEGMNDVAITALRQAVELDPNDYSAHLALAEEYQNKGQAEAAMEEYKAAVKLRGDEFIPRYNLGLLYARQPNDATPPAQRTAAYQSAITHLTEAVRIRSTDHLALSALGWVNLKANRVQESETWYAKAVQAAPEYQPARAYHGLVLQKLGKVDDAIKEWNEALRLDPKDTATRAQLASALIDRARYPLAIEQYRILVDEDPKDGNSWNNMGFALEKTAKLDDAMKAYERAVAANPRLAIAHNNLGAAHQRRGNKDKAREHYQKALQIDPSLKDAQKNLSGLDAK